MRIKLEGSTLKGKNRVKEHGQWWDVLDWFHPTDSIAFAIESVTTGDRRWITNDFKIIEKVGIECS
tara:strand:+ start:1170 stop:1367 length:198 start_codon:yes stop_codon:yes gene_type:complete